MLGNTIEWCQTPWRDRYPQPAGTEPWIDDEEIAPIEKSSLRVLRGGSFLAPEPDVRCAVRGRNQASLYFDTVGFRIARTIR
jgi:formylglycine-generating enzyme required for sulfatase activity